MHGDCTEIPDDRLSRIHVGSRRQQQTALARLERNGLDERVGCVPIDEFFERCAAVHARTEDRPQPARVQYVFTGSAGLDFHQLMVPGRAQEGIGRDQSPGAHARHHRELGPLSRLSQPDDGAGSECAAGAAAG
jgi:hypothetical protein